MSDTVPELDAVAAAALASIILARTADALSTNPELTAQAITELAADTGLALDVCAGVLMATSTLTGMGELPAELVAAAGMQLESSTADTLAGDQ